CSSSFFFFQAEDGIRDFHVTGVQTCALPIGAPTAFRPRAKLEKSGARCQGGRRKAQGNRPHRRDATALGTSGRPNPHNEAWSAAEDADAFDALLGAGWRPRTSMIFGPGAERRAR